MATPADAASATAPSDDPAASAAASIGPARSRFGILLATLAVGLLGIGATTAYAVGWARDLPKTIAFAVAQDPFGERSMLHPGNAQAGVDRVLAALPADQSVTLLAVDADRISVSTRGPDGRTVFGGTTITGPVDVTRTSNVAEDRGVPRAQLERIDVADGVRAAERRWRELGGDRWPPLVRLEIDGGRARGWQITFSSEVPEADRWSRATLDGRLER